MWEAIVNVLNEYAGLIVAVCALVLTIANMWLLRRHQERSTRPLLLIQPERHSGGDTFSYKLAVRNRGLGPAIIRRIEAEYDGDFTTIDELARARVGGQLPAGVTIFPLAKGDAMAARDERLIFSINTQLDHRDSKRDELKQRLQKVKIEIIYESLYGWRKKAVFRGDQQS